MTRNRWRTVLTPPGLAALLLCMQITGLARGAEIGAPFEKPDTVPEVKYINPTPNQRAKIPEIRGERTDEALVPDTCDLEEAARLLLEEYFMSITVPELDHEPFNRGRFTATPPRLTLDIGSYLCAWPKYREALPLMRIMTGSRKGLDVDRAWADHLLKCIGPDGLYYVPRVGRPWDDINWNGEHGAYWWKMPEGTTQYAALPLGNGRLLGAIGINLMMTGDETWQRIGNGIVDRMNQLAVKVDDVAFFPKFVWLPGEKLSEQETQAAIAAMMDQDVEETDKNTALWQTWIITGLAQYYRASQYEPAKDLAAGLTNYLKKSRYLEEWKSHFHCISLGIQACLEVGQITGDRSYSEYARLAYEEAKSGKRMTALPQIGYFVNQTSFWFKDREDPPAMEGCSIGDVTAIAVKLAQQGLGDQYWEDVDRYVRNCLIGIQRTRPDQMQTFFEKYSGEKQLPEVPVAYTELADDLPQRTVGTFAPHFYPNDMFADDYFDSCCIGNCARALYYVWEGMLEEKGKSLLVHLLLNRTGASADIQSQVPYTGRVDIRLKKKFSEVRVRTNDWIDKSAVVCTVSDANRPNHWEGNYLIVKRLHPGDVIELRFPITERYEELKTFGHQYQAVFRGNECVDISPEGKYHTLFQRDRYRTGETRYLKVPRFACSHLIAW